MDKSCWVFRARKNLQIFSCHVYRCNGKSKKKIHCNFSLIMPEDLFPITSGQVEFCSPVVKNALQVLCLLNALFESCCCYYNVLLGMLKYRVPAFTVTEIRFYP